MVPNSQQIVVERVLTVPTSTVEHLYEHPCFFGGSAVITEVLEAISAEGEFTERAWAEEHPSVKQIVSCAVVRNGPRFLCLRRSRKAKREQLRLRYTLLIGGHVSEPDGTLQTAPLRCVKRELHEELGIEPAAEPTLIGVVADPLTESGWLHLGLIYDAPILGDGISVTGDRDQSEFVYPRRHKECELVDLGLNGRFAANLDPWSELFVASDVYRSMIDDPAANGMHYQAYLSLR